MIHTLLEQQAALPRSIPVCRYTPKRSQFSLRDWNPATVECAENLPQYLILGTLDRASFAKSADGWSARWQGTEEDTHFDVAYKAGDHRWWISQTWQGVGDGFTFFTADAPLGTVIAQCVYREFPRHWDLSAKQRLESEYQITVIEQAEKISSICGIPDGAFRTIVFPVDVNNIRKIEHAIHDSIKRSLPMYPIDVEAKLVTQAVNYLEGKAPEWTTRGDMVLIQSLIETGLIPHCLPVRETAKDGSAAWTLRREIYFLFIRLPFAGLTDFLARISSKSGPILRVTDRKIRFELRPVVMPAAVELEAEHLYLWDAGRTTRTFLQLSSPEHERGGPTAQDATENGNSPGAALVRAETISDEVVEAMEQVLRQAAEAIILD
jgi:hypothetical protein